MYFNKGDKIYFVVETVPGDNEYVRIVTGNEREALKKAEEIFRVLVKRYKDKLFLKDIYNYYDGSILELKEFKVLKNFEHKDGLTYKDYWGTNSIGWGYSDELFCIRDKIYSPKKISSHYITRFYGNEIMAQEPEITKILSEKYKDVSTDILCTDIEIFDEVLDLIKIDGMTTKEFGYRYLWDNKAIKYVYNQLIFKRDPRQYNEMKRRLENYSSML